MAFPEGAAEFGSFVKVFDRFKPLLETEASNLKEFFDSLQLDISKRESACRERANMIEAADPDSSFARLLIHLRTLNYTNVKVQFVRSCVLSITTPLSKDLSSADVCNAIFVGEVVRFGGNVRVGFTDPAPCIKAIENGAGSQQVSSIVRRMYREAYCEIFRKYYVYQLLLGGPYLKWEADLKIFDLLQTSPTFKMLMELYQRCLTNLSKSDADAIPMQLFSENRANFFKELSAGMSLPQELNDAGVVSAPFIASLAAKVATMSDSPAQARELIARKFERFAHVVLSDDFLPLTRPRRGPVPILLSAIATAATGYPWLHPSNRSLPFYGGDESLARTARHGYSVASMQGFLALGQKGDTAIAEALNGLDELCAAVGGALGQLVARSWGGGGRFSSPSGPTRAAVRVMNLPPLQFTHSQACAESDWVFRKFLKLGSNKAFKALETCINIAKSRVANIVPRDFGAVSGALLTCALDHSGARGSSPLFDSLGLAPISVSARANFDDILSFFLSKVNDDDTDVNDEDNCVALVNAPADRMSAVRAVCGEDDGDDREDARDVADACTAEAEYVVGLFGFFENNTVSEAMTQSLALLCSAGEGRVGLLESLSRSDVYLREAQATQCGARLFAAMSRDGLALPTDEEVFILRFCNM
jgi:hypothetical protein